jgi:hypothetical protein
MRMPQRRPLLAVVTCLALAVPLSATMAPAVAASADAPAVAAEPVASELRINEVESSGGTPGDWIEIVNTGTTPADVSGYVLKDSAEDHAFVIPAGTTVAAGGYFVADVEEGDAGFGLGGGDSARLFAVDGTTLIDSFTWASHATSTTYGRCADGTGDFIVTVASTKGSANACTVSLLDAVRINEVDSSDATPVDWIELTNISSASVDVSGIIVRDNKDASVVVVPEGSTIAAGGFLAVDVDVTGGFGLGGSDAARVFLADGTTLVDSYQWTEHAATSYGRYPDGTGAFALTAAATKSAANERVAPPVSTLPTVVINEVESSGGTPDDWAEFFNTGTTALDMSGWIVQDNDDTDPAHRYSIPAGTTIAAGGYYVVESAALGYGLGSADSVRLWLADGVTLVDERSWTSHAATTYGLCGTEFVTTTSSTKGAANDCSAPVVINEVESQDGTTGDWIELRNNGTTAADISGYVLKDSAEDHAFVVPAATTLAAGGYYVADVEDGATGFGLGGTDSARLFVADGVTLIDSYSWASHATSTTYGRCADGTGEFALTAASTKGSVNDCVGDIVTTPWPGSADVATADVQNVLGGNMSGLAYEESEAGDVLWAAKHGPGGLYRLVDNGTHWASDTANGWGAGKVLHYADGTGDVDAEGVALTDAGAAGGIFISSERNNDANGVSRLSVLRYDTTSASTSTATGLNADMEWNLTADLPEVKPNEGLEAIAWIADEVLVAGGLLDESTNAAYNPATYAGHGDGLFFVGVEAGGTIYAYALNQTTGGFDRVATIASGFPGVMDLEFDAESGSLWAVCDDGCEGRSALLDIAQEGANDGRFVVSSVVERPASMPNLNNEGFAIAPQSECVAGSRAVFWADDSNTDGFALRTGSLDCVESTDPTDPTTPVDPTDPTDPTTPVDPTTPTDPTVPTPVPSAPGNLGASTPVSDAALTSDARGTVDAPATARAGSTITVTVGSALAGETVNVWLHSTPVLLGTRVVADNGTVSVTVPANTVAGEHRLVVLAEDGTLIGWDSITITGAASAGPAGESLASTGADTELPLGVALLLLIAGAGLVVLRRQRAAL